MNMIDKEGNFTIMFFIICTYLCTSDIWKVHRQNENEEHKMLELELTPELFNANIFDTLKH